MFFVVPDTFEGLVRPKRKQLSFQLNYKHITQICNKKCVFVKIEHCQTAMFAVKIKKNYQILPNIPDLYQKTTPRKAVEI